MAAKPNRPWVTVGASHYQPFTRTHPFLPPNFVDTNVHAAVAELAVGTIYVKFERSLPSDAKLLNMFFE